MAVFPHPEPLLLITSSHELAGQLVEVVGPLGVPLLVAPSMSAAGRFFLDESRLVFVGADQLETATPQLFGPHRQVFVLAHDGDAYATAVAERVLGSVVVFWLPAAAAWLTSLIHDTGIAAPMQEA